MILVVGACASGKRTYAASLGYVPADMADAMLNEKPVVYNVQDLAARWDENASLDELADALSAKDVVICNEVGSGVVPLKRADREARERTGRLCLKLAAHADRVVRLVCGIPQVLKG